MEKNKKGFTLIELVVVVAILGILASMGVPYYLRTVESGKASDAVAIGHMLANSYRMFRVDSPGVGLTGTITDACNSGACITTPAPGDTTGCRLVRCNYVARQSWNAASYRFTINSATPLVTVTRRTGPSPGTNTSPYIMWRYAFSDQGGCASFPPPPGASAAPTCPNF